MRRIVDAVFIKDQAVGQRGDLQESVPVHRVPGQERHFQAEHDAGPRQADLGYQSSESFAIGGRGARLPQIRIADNDPVQWPPQSDGLLPKRILPLRTLGVFQHLTQSGLTDIEISTPLEVAGFYILMCVVSYWATSRCFSRNRPARIATISDCMPGGSICGLGVAVAATGCGTATTAEREEQTSIHSHIPCCRNRANPGPRPPARTRARRSS